MSIVTTPLKTLRLYFLCELIRILASGHLPIIGQFTTGTLITFQMSIGVRLSAQLNNLSFRIRILWLPDAMLALQIGPHVARTELSTIPRILDHLIPNQLVLVYNLFSVLALRQMVSHLFALTFISLRSLKGIQRESKVPNQAASLVSTLPSIRTNP